MPILAYEDGPISTQSHCTIALLEQDSYIFVDGYYQFQPKRSQSVILNVCGSGSVRGFQITGNRAITTSDSVLKSSARWVPRLLTPDNKSHPKATSQFHYVGRCLSSIQGLNMNSLMPQTKEQQKQWTSPVESAQKRRRLSFQLEDVHRFPGTLVGQKF